MDIVVFFPFFFFFSLHSNRFFLAFGSRAVRLYVVSGSVFTIVSDGGDDLRELYTVNNTVHENTSL